MIHRATARVHIVAGKHTMSRLVKAVLVTAFLLSAATWFIYPLYLMQNRPRKSVAQLGLTHRYRVHSSEIYISEFDSGIVNVSLWVTMGGFAALIILYRRR